MIGTIHYLFGTGLKKIAGKYRNFQPGILFWRLFLKRRDTEDKESKGIRDWHTSEKNWNTWQSKQLCMATCMGMLPIVIFLNWRQIRAQYLAKCIFHWTFPMDLVIIQWHLLLKLEYFSMNVIGVLVQDSFSPLVNSQIMKWGVLQGTH